MGDDWIGTGKSIKDLGTALKPHMCEPCEITLHACNAGTGSLAQELANATGCKVHAPMGYCYVEHSIWKKCMIKHPDTGAHWDGATGEAETFEPDEKVTPYKGKFHSGKKASKENKSNKVEK